MTTKKATQRQQQRQEQKQRRNAGVPFDFAQGRLLHSATDDETVYCSGRDDAFSLVVEEAGTKAVIALGEAIGQVLRF
jgi:hypothetical protein